jgi:hypothetical protein
VLALESLVELKHKPLFISIESECEDNNGLKIENHLATLNILYKLGYKKFKLVDQLTLCVLEPNTPFYYEESFLLSFLKTTEWGWLLYYRIFKQAYRRKLFTKLKYYFPIASSGPFGYDLDSQWLDYSTAKETLNFHRESSLNTNHVFWCDWHAKLY